MPHVARVQLQGGNYIVRDTWAERGWAHVGIERHDDGCRPPPIAKRRRSRMMTTPSLPSQHVLPKRGPPRRCREVNLSMLHGCTDRLNHLR